MDIGRPVVGSTSLAPEGSNGKRSSLGVPAGELWVEEWKGAGGGKTEASSAERNSSGAWVSKGLAAPLPSGSSAGEDVVVGPAGRAVEVGVTS